MQAVKLILPGSYYDSQIYSGRLYLWGIDGSLTVLDWDKVVESVGIPESLQIALRCAFQRSDYLYGTNWDLIFQDAEVKSLIERKFQELADTPLEVPKQELDNLIVTQQDNPFPFPHADSAIYYNTIYVGSQSGVFSAGFTRRSRLPSRSQLEQLWDMAVLGVAPSYMTLALAAGSEGVFEYHLNGGHSYGLGSVHQLMKQHSSAVHWLYGSVFSSSYLNEGYLADFSIEKDPETDQQRRELRDIFPSTSIFRQDTDSGRGRFVWGLHDKIWLAELSRIKIVRYNPFKDENQRFIDLGTASMNALPDDIIGADSALFGLVIEGEQGLLVVNSLQESEWIAGEPVNWRVFPRSKFYENQLHVVYDDYLCIYSFNQDYFVDQDTKLIGIRRPKVFGSRMQGRRFG